MYSQLKSRYYEWLQRRMIMYNFDHIATAYALSFLILCSYCSGRTIVKHGGRRYIKRIIVGLIIFFCFIPIYSEITGLRRYPGDELINIFRDTLFLFVLPLLMSIPSRSVLKIIARIKRSF
jgi:hypothetical protein